MATITSIDLGTTANDGTGDNLRAAGGKINTNFANVNAELASLSGTVLATSSPNLWPDPEFRNILQFTNPSRVTRTTMAGDRPAISVSGGAAPSPKIPRSLFDGDTASLGFTYTKPAQAGQQVFLRQVDAAGSILTQTAFSLPNGAVTDPTYASITGISIDADCDAILVVPSPGADNPFVIADITVVAGSSAGLRPSLRPLTDSIEAFAELATKPNRVPVTYLASAANWSGSGTITAVQDGDRSAIHITGGSGFFAVPRSSIVGNKYSASIVIEDKPASTSENVRILFRQRDAGAGTLVDTEIVINDPAVEGPQVWEFKDVDLDVDCDHILVFINASGTAEITVSRICIVDGGSPTFRPPFTVVEAARSMYVDPAAGDDSDPGTYASPKKTLQAACDALEGRGTIIVGGGDPGSLNMANVINLNVEALPGSRPIIRLGTQVANVAKTSGLTNVYEGDLAFAPIHYLLIDDLPESAIDIADRRALHRGRSHRAPVSGLVAASGATQASDLDAPGMEGTYWFDSGNNKVYMRGPNDEDLTNYDIYRPRLGSGFEGGVEGQSGFIRVAGFEARYGTYCFNMKWMAYCELEDCEGWGAASAGVFRFDQVRGIGRRLVGGLCDNDTYSLHFLPIPTPAEDYADQQFTLEDIRSYRAADDACSNHERIDLIVRHALFEDDQNGLTPAAGATCWATNVACLRTRGTAFSAATQPDVDTGRTESTLEVEHAEVVGYEEGSPAVLSTIGFSVQTGTTAANVIRAKHVRTYNCAEATKIDYGHITMEDWRDSGSDVVKATPTNGGTLTVITEPALVTP